MISKEKQNYFETDNLIDIGILIRFFNRNKLIVSLITTLSFLIASIYAFKKDKIWEGKFQIVLENEKSSKLSDVLGNSPIRNFSKSLASNNLKTEVGILESPSILLQTFIFVEDYYKKNYLEKKISYEKWKNDHLRINLRPNTSILNISYRDKSKELIIPVLEKISTSYQDYSGRNKRRNIELRIKYFEEQINIFKEKAKESFSKLQSFSIDENLEFVLLNRNSSEQIDTDISNPFEGQNSYLKSKFSPFQGNTTIENIRVQAAQELKDIDIQIEKINSLEWNDEDIQYISLNIPALVREGFTDKASAIDLELKRKRLLYRENDIEIKNLIKEKEFILVNLKNRAIKILGANRLAAQSRMESAMRPKEVLDKYKELRRKAVSDENTLINLENQYRSTKLQKAQIEDPWQLITIPTLNERPVAPKKRNIAFLGLLIGFLTSTIYSFLRERQENIVYESIFLSEIFEKPILQEIFEGEINSSYLKNILSDESIEVVNFINLGVSDLTVIKFTNYINKNFKERKINIFEKLDDITSDNVNILLTSLGRISKDQVLDLKNSLVYKKVDIIGIIVSEN